MGSMSLVQLNVPEVGPTELSFCASANADLEQWVAGLPLVNTTETSTQLQNAVIEIAALNAAAGDKLQYLEILRPTVHYICTRLDRQTITKPTQHSGSAITAQRLLENLCTGYKSVVLPLLRENPKGEDGKANKDSGELAILQVAVHRLISDMSRTLLRALQHYIPTADDFWLEINGLFLLCEERRLTDFRCRDEENHGVADVSIVEAYLRVLLLAACKPNQLNQQNLTLVFNAVELWASQATLVKDIDQALLCVDLAADRGPQFLKLSRKMQEPRALRTEVLAYEIEAYLKKIESALVIPETLPIELLNHLVEAWSVMQSRTFHRLPASGPVRVCVGLRACHYFLSGGIEFANQLTGAETLLRREVNPFIDVQFEDAKQQDDDPWSQAHDLKVAMPQNPDVNDPEQILLANLSAQPTKEQPFHHYETEALDTSPGGYCIRWTDPMPSNCQVGELMALREERDARWCVALIRWIRHRSDGATMGIELLSPKAIPVAIRVVRKRGGPTDFARALVLPEIKVIRQAATIITPRVPFAEAQKLNIQRQGIQTTGQLTEIQLNTESVSQFTFRMLDGYLENSRSDRTITDLSEMTREDTT